MNKEQEQTENNNNQKELSSMPTTRNILANKNFLNNISSRKYRGLHSKANINKVKAIKKRQHRLLSLGWNLLYF